MYVFMYVCMYVQATTWVKVESEKVFKQGKLGSVYEGVQQPNLAYGSSSLFYERILLSCTVCMYVFVRPCYEEFADESAAYDNSCASFTETVETATATATAVDPSCRSP